FLPSQFWRATQVPPPSPFSPKTRQAASLAQSSGGFPQAIATTTTGQGDMHKLLATLLSLSLTLSAAAQDNVGTAPSLTIYNQNFFVARDHLTLDLKPGANHIDFAGVTAHLEPDSVILRDLTGRPLQILEQSYRADPISQEMLLSFYEGKTIDFQIQRGEKFETF